MGLEGISEPLLELLRAAEQCSLTGNFDMRLLPCCLRQQPPAQYLVHFQRSRFAPTIVPCQGFIATASRGARDYAYA